MRERCRIRRFAPGDVIVQEGEAGGTAFILLSGRCEVTVHGETLNLIHPGELFGEIACLEAGTRTATVRAAVESDVLELAERRCDPSCSDRPHCSRSAFAPSLTAFETSPAERRRCGTSSVACGRMLENLQPSLDRFKDHPLLAVEVRWQPISFASGDYYDILELSPDRLLFALGDVMGHGAPTTPIVGMMRGQLHEIASAESRPHELLARLHRHMLRHGHPNVFMTLTLLMLDLNSLTAEFAIGGPPCPLLHRNGRCTPLTTQSGWTLGYPFGGVSFQSESIPMAHGDTLLFYTDGLSDATRGPDRERDTLGADGLADDPHQRMRGRRTGDCRGGVRGGRAVSGRVAGRRRCHGVRGERALSTTSDRTIHASSV